MHLYTDCHFPLPFPLTCRSCLCCCCTSHRPCSTTLATLPSSSMAGTITTLTQCSLSQKALWTSGEASTSYCGGAAHTGRVQLTLRRCSSHCGGAAYSAEMQLILWGVQLILRGAVHTASVCPISTSLILYSVGNGLVWPANVAITLTVRV